MSVSTIRDLQGIYVGHATDAVGATGCTVVVCPEGAVGGVDVRGAAPATRETDLLRPEQTVGVLHAVLLSGGSAFGLEASCGVANELERRGVGLDVGVVRVPIVSGACLFDLMCGSAQARPDLAMGVRAVRDAYESAANPLPRGNVGAGTGCTVGKTAGPQRCCKSGLGEGVCEAGGLVCAAVAAVNAVGDVIDPSTGAVLAGVRDASDLARFAPGGSEGLLLDMAATMPLPRTNTTISCVVTNAKLTKAQACKVAQMSADAYAHVIRPVHTTNDGDTVFVMATGEVEYPVDVVGVAATRALEHAIVDGVRSATSAYGYPAACDWA